MPSFRCGRVLDMVSLGLTMHVSPASSVEGGTRFILTDASVLPVMPARNNSIQVLKQMTRLMTVSERKNWHTRRTTLSFVLDFARWRGMNTEERADGRKERGETP